MQLAENYYRNYENMLLSDTKAGVVSRFSGLDRREHCFVLCVHAETILSQDTFGPKDSSAATNANCSQEELDTATEEIDQSTLEMVGEDSVFKYIFFWKIDSYIFGLGIHPYYSGGKNLDVLLFVNSFVVKSVYIRTFLVFFAIIGHSSVG